MSILKIDSDINTYSKIKKSKNHSEKVHEQQAGKNRNKVYSNILSHTASVRKLSCKRVEKSQITNPKINKAQKKTLTRQEPRKPFTELSVISPHHLELPTPLLLKDSNFPSLPPTLLEGLVQKGCKTPVLPQSNQSRSPFSKIDHGEDVDSLVGLDKPLLERVNSLGSEASLSAPILLKETARSLVVENISNTQETQLKPLSIKSISPKAMIKESETNSFVRKVIKESSLYFDLNFYNYDLEAYKNSEKVLCQLIEVLKALEVPRELIKIEKAFFKSLDSFPLETKVTVLLSWREISALCDRSKTLENLLLKGRSSQSLRPLAADNQADHFVKIAREVIGTNSIGETTPFWELPSDIDSFQGILSSAFDHFQGICFGELHDKPKTFLIDHFKHMKACGVQILFMEHLMYDTMQIFLDKYFLDEPAAKMPIPLAAYLKSLDEGFELDHSKHNFTALVKTAKMYDIRVVGIDTSLSYEAGYTMEGSVGIKRYLGMNYVAEEIIEWETSSSKTKYVALMGFFHGATAHASSKGDTILTDYRVPGVAEMLVVPFIIIEPSNDNVNLIQKDVHDYIDAVNFVNMVISGYRSGEPITIKTCEVNENKIVCI
jgi:hypothetical protein